MQFETNTSSAGAILDYMPQLMRDEMISDLVIMPEHEDTKHHGGVRFRLQSNNKDANWEIIHNFNDYFDITLTDETGTVIQDRDIHAGTLINAFVDILDNHFDSIANAVNDDISESEEE